MSLISSFKKALGFPDEYEDLEDISDLEDADDTQAADGSSTSQAIDSSDQDYHDSLEREIKSLKQSNAIFNEQRRQFENDRLSSDRQRRALNNRIENLETRIRELEAEREQLMLENKSMINRLRGVAMPVVNSGSTGSEVKRLTDENNALRRELNNLKRQIATAAKDDRPTREEMTAIEEKIAEFEKLKAKLTGDISQLKSELLLANEENTHLGRRVTELSAEKADLEKTVTQLYSTIDANLRSHATSEAELRNEIKRLTDIINSAPHKSEKADKVEPNLKKQKKHRGKKADKSEDRQPEVKISAIDELMDSTDWFSAPEPGPRIKDPEVMDSFGYKETPKKPNKKHDENQLTLF